MDLAYSDEQEFLREAVRGVVDRDAPFGKVRDWTLGEAVDLAPAAELAVQQGWTGIGIPEEAGGQGGGPIEIAILAEELGRGAVPADSLYASLLLALALHESDGAATQVAQLTEGELAGVLLRPGDAPLDAPFSGEAPDLVLGAPGAALFARWDGDALDLFDRAQVEPRRMVDRTRALGRVTMLPDEPLMRVEGVGIDRMRHVAACGAVLVAADALGAAQRMLDLTVEYVSERVQFGVPVGSFQAVKHSAAEMLVAIEGTRGTVQYASWALGAGAEGAELDAWVAKARAARMAKDVADRALFLHGAVGYTWEHDLHLLLKRAKSDAALLGDAGAYEARIADALELVPESAHSR